MHITNIAGIFPAFAWLQSDDPLSLNASATRTSPTDVPAVLVICEDEAEQARLLATVTELLRQGRARAIEAVAEELAS